MNAFQTIWRRLRSLGQRGAVKQEIDEELRFHLEQRTAENIAAGMAPEDAAREARKRFGNLQSVREECRERVGLGFGERLWQDLRFGARLLGKNPGFTTIAVLTLALGIGATSAVLSLIHGVLLTAPPYSKPEELVLVSPARLDGRIYNQRCTTAQWMEWEKSVGSLDDIAGYAWGFQMLVMKNGSESVQGMFVTPNYFRLLGLKPLVGREFESSESPQPNESASLIILGNELWKRRFHGDSNIIGRVVHLSRRGPLTVVGVMPPGIRFLPCPGVAEAPNYDLNAEVDFWVPLNRPDTPDSKDAFYCNVIGRLRPGVTAREAQAEFTAIAARQVQTAPELSGITAHVQGLKDMLNREGQRILVPMLGAVTLVFLIACANVAGLQLARGLKRQQEYSLRCALGAQRTQLFVQVLTESLLLALTGGVLGVCLAAGLVKGIKVFGSHAIPRLDAVTLGGSVLLSCLAAAGLAALLAGLGAAFHAIRQNTADALKGVRASGGSVREHRFLGAITVFQIALTIALLVSAGLLIRTVGGLARLRPGYDFEKVLTMSVTTPAWNDAAIDFHSQALMRISRIPGVEHVAFGWGVPLTGNNWNNEVEFKGDAGGGNVAGLSLPVSTRSVTEGYFNALGFTLKSGRGFRQTDAWFGIGAETNAPFVVMINEVMAERLFDRRDPVGRKIYFSDTGEGREWGEVIGVVADARDNSLAEAPRPEVYFYFWQLPAYTKHLVVRTDSDPRSLIAAMQRELRAIDPSVAIEQVKTMTQVRTDSISRQTFAMRLLVGFALVGGILAVVGIYGVLSLSVKSRKREIAIRMAVGAQRRNIFGVVLSEGLKLIVVGLVIGTGMAIALAQILRGFLFGVEPTDPLTFMGVAFLFTVVALLACYIPARRATKIDPMVALRYE